MFLRMKTAAALLSLAAAAAASAAEAPSTTASSAAPTQQLRVYRDPATGKLISQPATPEQAAAARQNPLRVDPSKVQVIEHASGTKQAKLNGQYRSEFVLERRADGTLEAKCTDATHDHTTHAAPTQEARDDR